MNSSKIFKEDSSFVPTTLVQEVIIEQKLHDEDTEVPSEIHPQPDQPSLAEEQTTAPEPELPLQSEQRPPPPPEPKIDTQALQQEAYDKGVADCTASHHQEMETAVNAFHEACQKIDTLHQSMLERYRSDIINTVIGLSQRVIGHELVTNRDVIAKTLENALQQAITCDEFIVTVHPDDLNAVENSKAELMTKIRGLENIIIQTDQEVSRGGCLIESKTCSVDATIGTQLESAQEFLEENTLSFTAEDDTPTVPQVEQPEAP